MHVIRNCSEFVADLINSDLEYKFNRLQYYFHSKNGFAIMLPLISRRFCAFDFFCAALMTIFATPALGYVSGVGQQLVADV